jgi:hypothetical protein
MKPICLAASLLALSATAAASQCGPRESVIKMLADDYGETVRASGLAGVSGQTAVMELFASDANGTWTITMTGPDGTMCLAASGTLYNGVVEPKLPANL